MKSAEDLLSEITDPAMRARLTSIHQGIKKCQRKQTQKPKSAEIVQLPLWPEPARGVPNSALRGALFAAIQGKDRHYMKRELLTVQNGMEICFTGMQLDQSDMDVWEQALHLARIHPLGTRCEFTAHAFLKALGRSTGKPMHEWLKDVFHRLTACAVEIKQGPHVYVGSMIEAHYRNDDTGYYILKINPDIIKLYTAGWTAIDWQQRQQLRRKPLALWLHGYYASHAKPFPVKVEKLMQLSGSRNQARRSYITKLKKAHEDLLMVGAIREFEIQDGLVFVDNVPSASQQKHLTRARPRK
jgi:hypothetical protein